jgi:shikimate dehydrogenase
MERRGVPPIKHIVGAHQLDARHLVIDLVYTPLVTPWLGVARANGATILGGLGMLVHQAAAQIELWTGTQAPVKAMWEAAISALQRADED